VYFKIQKGEIYGFDRNFCKVGPQMGQHYTYHPQGVPTGVRTGKGQGVAMVCEWGTGQGKKNSDEGFKRDRTKN